MSNNYLKLYQNTYGILIPSEELLSRVKYGWFIRLSPKQVLNSDTIIGNYLLLSNVPDEEGEILTPVQPIINKEIENTFISFWSWIICLFWAILDPISLASAINFCCSLR